MRPLALFVAFAIGCFSQPAYAQYFDPAWFPSGYTCPETTYTFNDHFQLSPEWPIVSNHCVIQTYCPSPCPTVIYQRTPTSRVPEEGLPHNIQQGNWTTPLRVTVFNLANYTQDSLLYSIVYKYKGSEKFHQSPYYFIPANETVRIMVDGEVPEEVHDGKRGYMFSVTSMDPRTNQQASSHVILHTAHKDRHERLELNVSILQLRQQN